MFHFSLFYCGFFNEFTKRDRLILSSLSFIGWLAVIVLFADHFASIPDQNSIIGFWALVAIGCAGYIFLSVYWPLLSMIFHVVFDSEEADQNEEKGG